MTRLKFFYAMEWNGLETLEGEVNAWMERNPDVEVRTIRTIASSGRFVTEVLYETESLKVRA